MKKSNILKISISIICCLLFAVIIFSWPKIIQLSYRSFTDKNYFYSYPRTWQELSKDEFKKYNEQVDRGIVKKKSTNSSVAVYVQFIGSDKEFNREKTIEEMDRYLKKRHNTYEKKSAKLIDFYDALAIDYTFNYSFIKEFKGEVNYRTERQIIFYQNGKLYDIIFSADPKDFESDNKDFNKILATFSLVNN